MSSSIIPLYQQIDKIIVKSKGCFQYDNNDKQYIDFESGDWAANLGHSNDKISQIVKDQVDLFVHDGLRFKNQQSEDLSIKLLDKLSFIGGKSVFLNSGSEAVNFAILIAKNLTKRSQILKMDCSYLSAYGLGQNSTSNPDLINVSIDNINQLSQIDFGNIAAFILESGNSSGLIRFPNSDFINSIISKIKQNNGLLVANEVTTGFGRTGMWFGFQHYDFKPDIVAYGKALGNGYPISGVSVSQNISERFDKSPFRYAQSHQNDPLGCAIGLGVIGIFDKENIIEKSFSTGQYFYKQLLQLQDKHSEIVDVRGKGLMLAIEFDKNINVEIIYKRLIENGFLVGFKEKTLRFMPPLIIDNLLIDNLISNIDSIINEQLAVFGK